MVRVSSLIRSVGAVLVAQMLGCAALAAVPVVESSPTRASSSPATTSAVPATPYEGSGVRSYGVDQNQAGSLTRSDVAQSAPAATAGGGGGGYSNASELFMRFQQLEADVAQMRGQLEEQSYQIERLTQQQKEQYLDLDKRVALALKGAPSSAAATPSGGPMNTTPSTGDASPRDDAGPPSGGGYRAGGSERDAYDIAFDLTKQRRFNDAINAFNDMLVNYPNGAYAGNAFYWLGQLYLALPEPNLEKSRQSFAQVINLYPTNQKVGDAMYKLGMVYHRLGDRAKALEYLNRVLTQFPGTPEARLAQSYSAELR